MPGLWIPMVTFSALYLLLAGVVVWAIWRHIAATMVLAPDQEVRRKPPRMPSYELIVAAALVGALTFYLLFGGADFGAGIWTLLRWVAKGNRNGRSSIKRSVRSGKPTMCGSSSPL